MVQSLCLYIFIFPMTQQLYFCVFNQKKLKHTSKTCIRMFTAALFMIAQTGNNPSIHHQEKEQIVVYSQNAILLRNKTMNYWYAKQHE